MTNNDKALHLELSPEQIIVRALIVENHNPAPGNTVVKLEGVTNHPPTLHIDSWMDPITHVINVYDMENSNPYLYKAEQKKVFQWARSNVFQPEYQMYSGFGNHSKGRIFYNFALQTVMSAMIPQNIRGPFWHQVQANLIPWQDFVHGINPDDWNQEGSAGIRHNDLATATGGFVYLNESYVPQRDFNDSGWAILNRQGQNTQRTAGFDIRRATNITVVPPEDIPEWTYQGSLDPVENFFAWEPARYKAFLRKVFEVIPLDIP